MFTPALVIPVRRLVVAICISITAMLAACGGGGSSSGPTISAQGCTSSSCGTALVNVMDADGDFMSYTVDVVSLKLKKANGAEVETLPVQPRIDFAGLVDLKELLSAATVPNGDYVSGTLRLDYTNADIEVDVGGSPVKATPVDSNGQPVTTLDLAVQLDNRHHLVIAPGRPALLELDFDLAASNAVDLTTNPVQVAVQPFVVASVNVADSREGRVRGPLISVDTANSSYRADLRPFNLLNGKFGTVSVHTTADTAFEIDGVTYTGAAGLTALAALSAGAPTAAFGNFTTADRTFTATRVNAGSSVLSAQFDAIEGSVIARAGNTLTVRGATLIRRTGSVVFERADVTLLVGSNTMVTKAGEPGNNFGIDALSVGQHIHVFGDATEASNGDVTVDATAGRVRMQFTHLAGWVQSTVPGTLTLNLQSIDGHRVSVFDFSGTSTMPGQDADPANYAIATGNLSLDNLDAGEPARVFGFVTPFGAAPPDFTGRTIVDYRDARAQLVMGWGLNGTSAPFLSADSGGIVIDTANPAIGLRHSIEIGPTSMDILSLSAAPRIVTDTAKDGMFAIGEPRRVEIFDSFSDFAAALNTKLSGGGKLIALHATGTFDAGTSQLTSQRVLATFNAGT